MLKKFVLLLMAVVLVYLAGSTRQVTASGSCIPNCGIDDTLYQTDCCSGEAVPGSTWCDDPADYGTTWASCHQICGPCPPPPPDCAQFDFGGCVYSWDSSSQCCVAPPPSPGFFCPDACF
jgi:hypothetical protein